MAEAAKLTAEVASLRATVQSLQSSLSEVKDTQAVQWLLNHNTAPHDDACFDLNKRQERENLFAEGGVAIYPLRSAQGPSRQRSLGFWRRVILRALSAAQQQFRHPFQPGPKEGIRQDQLHRAVDEAQGDL